MLFGSIPCDLKIFSSLSNSPTSNSATIFGCGSGSGCFSASFGSISVTLYLVIVPPSSLPYAPPSINSSLYFPFGFCLSSYMSFGSIPCDLKIFSSLSNSPTSNSAIVFGSCANFFICSCKLLCSSSNFCFSLISTSLCSGSTGYSTSSISTSIDAILVLMSFSLFSNSSLSIFFPSFYLFFRSYTLSISIISFYYIFFNYFYVI